MSSSESSEFLPDLDLGPSEDGEATRFVPSSTSRRPDGNVSMSDEASGAPKASEVTLEWLQKQGTDFELAEGVEALQPERRPVIGDYVILEKIGSGGMGQVFRARHRTMQRDVAIKLLPRGLSKHPEWVDRFYGEVRAVGRLMHPNIVTAFDAGCISQVHYLVMELIDGSSLSHKIASHGLFSVAEVVNILVQAASALHYAHSMGVIHRDIKPGNMMLNSKGVLKILDFGLAHFRHEVVRESEQRQLVGTVEYMSPEQVDRPGQVDHRTDMYSLGATLFFLLTGKPLFAGDPIQTALSHVQKRPPALYEVRSDLDLRIDSVFQRLVAKHPDDRFPDAQGIIEQLRELNLLDENSIPNAKSTLKLAGFSVESLTRATSNQTTSQRGYAAVGIELGMISSRMSYMESTKKLVEIPMDGDSCSMKSIVWSDGEKLAIGDAAAKLRGSNPNHVFFGFQRWFGLPILERPFAGRQVPPEVLLATVLKQMVRNAAPVRPNISHAVLTVPACYDQLHRLSVSVASRIAGLEVLQLLDRPLAASIAFLETNRMLRRPNGDSVDHFLVLGLTGEACEASVVRVEGDVARMVATHGDWKRGKSRWQHRFTEHLAKKFLDTHGKDVRSDLVVASRLQRSVELALDRLTVANQVEVRFEAWQKEIQWVIHRDDLSHICPDLIQDLMEFPRAAIADSGIDPQKITQVLVYGDLMSLQVLQNPIRKLVGRTVPLNFVSKSDLARGAALQAAYVMPPSDSTLPHAESVSTYDMGLVVLEGTTPKSLPKVLIPKGTPLPFQYNKAVRIGTKANAQTTLQFVESTRTGGVNWHRLGAVCVEEAFPKRAAEYPLQLRVELDTSGLSVVQLGWLAGNSQINVPQLAEPMMDAVAIKQWHDWIETLLMCHS